MPIDHLCLFDKIIMELHGRFVGQDKIDTFTNQLIVNGFSLAAEDGYSVAYIKNEVDAPK